MAAGWQQDRTETQRSSSSVVRSPGCAEYPDCLLLLYNEDSQPLRSARSRVRVSVRASFISKWGLSLSRQVKRGKKGEGGSLEHWRNTDTISIFYQFSKLGKKIKQKDQKLDFYVKFSACQKCSLWFVAPVSLLAYPIWTKLRSFWLFSLSSQHMCLFLFSKIQLWTKPEHKEKSFPIWCNYTLRK